MMMAEAEVTEREVTPASLLARAENADAAGLAELVRAGRHAHHRAAARWSAAQAIAEDPGVDETAAQNAAADLVSLEVVAKRLGRTVDLLESRRADALEAEAMAARLDQYRAAAIARDKCIARLQTYPALAAELAELLMELQSTREQLRRANAARPAGTEHLQDPETMARGIASNAVDSFGLCATTKLPRFSAADAAFAKLYFSPTPPRWG